KPLETTECPFRNRPKTNERPHWVRPELVAQVRFTEWTADAKLRHPVYLGLRDDKKQTDVRREDTGRVQGSGFSVHGSGSRSGLGSRSGSGSSSRSGAAETKRSANSAGSAVGADHAALAGIIDQLSELENARRDGTIELPDGDRLKVTNLAKPFWPKLKLTKGDLLRYYARVA